MEAQLERYLHESIPLSQAMGLKVKIASPERILLECPFEPNINHHGTAFGGSIVTLATLAGWSWIHVFMRERKLSPKLVIAESNIQYLQPISSLFTAELRAPSEEDIKAFTQAFDRRGSARLELKVSVLCKGDEAAVFRGTYVALKA